MYLCTCLGAAADPTQAMPQNGSPVVIEAPAPRVSSAAVTSSCPPCNYDNEQDDAERTFTFNFSCLSACGTSSDVVNCTKDRDAPLDDPEAHWAGISFEEEEKGAHSKATADPLQTGWDLPVRAGTKTRFH